MNYQGIFWSSGKKDLDAHKNRLQGAANGAVLLSGSEPCKQSIGVFGLVPSTDRRGDYGRRPFMDGA